MSVDEVMAQLNTHLGGGGLVDLGAPGGLEGSPSPLSAGGASLDSFLGMGAHGLNGLAGAGGGSVKAGASGVNPNGRVLVQKVALELKEGEVRVYFEVGRGCAEYEYVAAESSLL